MILNRVARPARKRWLGAMALAAAVLGAFASAAKADDDPNQLLAQADAMLHEGRVMQARIHAEQAMAIFAQRGDRLGLAQTWREHGLIARENGFGDDPVVYVEPHTPLNPTPAALDLADSDLTRAAAMAVTLDELYMASNIYYLLGTDQVLRGEKLRSCAYYDQAIAASDDALRKHPGVAIGTLNGYHSMAEGLADMKRQAGCPAS